MNKKGRPRLEDWETNDFVREIEIRCACGRSHKVARSWEILELVSHLECNFCPVCESKHEGEKWFEKMVIKHNTHHGFRHRFNLDPIKMNGEESRLHNPKMEPALEFFTSKAFKGYLRNIREPSGYWTWRYIEECVCDHRKPGEYWDPDSRDRCSNCGGAIPSAAEKKERKKLAQNDRLRSK